MRQISIFALSLFFENGWAQSEVGFERGSQEILLPSGQGSFEIQDFDGDGDVDIWITQRGQITFYSNDGRGEFTFSGELFEAVFVVYVKSFDADQDGDLDVWIRNEEDEISIWQQENGQFNLIDVLSNVGSGDPLFGDIDLDGDIDVIVPTQRSHSSNSNSSNSSNSDSSDSDSSNPIDPIDLSSKGHQQWLNTGSGLFQFSHLLPSPEEKIHGIGGDLADLDGDEDLDLVAIYADHSLRIWLNSGEGQFTDSNQELTPTLESEIQFASILTGDFDGDDDLDLIKSSIGQDQLWKDQLWKNQGNGFFEEPIHLGSVSEILQKGDFDNDGKLDLLAVKKACDCEDLWLQSEGQLHPILSIFSSNISVHQLSVADLDSDGDTDLVAKMDIIEAPSSRSVIGTFLNKIIDLSTPPPRLGTIFDPTLAFIIRDRLGLPPDLSFSPNYSGLTELVIDADDFGSAFSKIKDLSGIEEMSDLEVIHLNGVLDFSSKNGVLDLSNLSNLKDLRHLELKDNGLKMIIIPSDLSNMISINLDGNELTKLNFVTYFPNLKSLSARQNHIEQFDLSLSFPRLDFLDLSENPLQKIGFIAGISELMPSVSEMRNRGIDVEIIPRLISISPLEGQPRIRLLADSGRFAVRRSSDLIDWRTLREVQIEHANSEITLVDDSEGIPSHAFYSIVSIENDLTNDN